jgi:hypothetical protein
MQSTWFINFTAFIIFISVFTSVYAQSPKDLNSRGPAWVELGPVQKHALQPLQKEWINLSINSKNKWLKIADKFSKMTPEEQLRVQQRMIDWANLSPNERDHARIQFQISKHLSAEERKARWEAYQELSVKEKTELAAMAETKKIRKKKQAPYGNIKSHAPNTDINNLNSQKFLFEKNNKPNNFDTPNKPNTFIYSENPGVTTKLKSKINLFDINNKKYNKNWKEIFSSYYLIDPLTLLPFKRTSNL